MGTEEELQRVIERCGLLFEEVRWDRCEAGSCALASVGEDASTVFGGCFMEPYKPSCCVDYGREAVLCGSTG